MAEAWFASQLALEVFLAQRTERELLRDIRNGRRQACTEFVRQHYQSIYRFLGHLTQNTNVTEDLTQETFAAAWANIGSFKGRSSLATWLHRIAYAKWADSIRRLQRQAALPGRLKQERIGSQESSSPLYQLITNERSRILYDAVHALEPPDRAVVVLHYIQGMSFREMAKVLEEPVGTVKWRTSQAVGRLRASLNGRV